MSELAQPEIIAQLESLAEELEVRLIGDTSSYEPSHEVEFSGEVDQFCCLMTDGQLPEDAFGRHSSAPVFTPMIIRLVLWRVRDAQRHVRASSPESFLQTVASTFTQRELLVDWWHTYAKSYRRERVELHEVQARHHRCGPLDSEDSSAAIDVIHEVLRYTTALAAPRRTS